MACGHYSVTDAMRCEQDICYYQNSIKRKQGDFDMYDSDTVYFAHCYPLQLTPASEGESGSFANPSLGTTQ